MASRRSDFGSRRDSRVSPTPEVFLANRRDTQSEIAVGSGAATRLRKICQDRLLGTAIQFYKICQD
jgi:hypothetical protein